MFRNAGGVTMSCRGSRVVCFAVAILGTCGLEEVVAQYHHYYFKEPRPLTLDPSRIAVFQDPSVRGGLVADLPKLEAYGIDDGGMSPMVIPGWHLAPTKPEKQSGDSIVQIVAQIGEARMADFVSPVFIGSDGGPVIVTPNILIGFDRNIDAARAEAILAEADVGAILDRDWAAMRAPTD